MTAAGYTDRDVTSFENFTRTYNADVKQVLNQPRDHESRMESLVESDIAGAIVAVQCAAPLREEYQRVWDEFAVNFPAVSSLPPVPGD